MLNYQRVPPRLFRSGQLLLHRKQGGADVHLVALRPVEKLDGKLWESRLKNMEIPSGYLT
jgi:hypothetical protein